MSEESSTCELDALDQLAGIYGHKSLLERLDKWREADIVSKQRQYKNAQNIYRNTAKNGRGFKLSRWRVRRKLRNSSWMEECETVV